MLSVGLLGLAHLQLTTLKHAQTAEFRSQASILAADILNKIRTNQVAARTSDFNVALGDPLMLESSPSMAQYDLVQWQARISQSLPQGEGAIDCPTVAADEVLICQITIRWIETQIGDADEDYGELGYSEFIFSGAV